MHLEWAGGTSSLVADADGYLMRLHGYCDFALDHARRHARANLAPETREEAGSLLIGGFLAAVLSLVGR